MHQLTTNKQQALNEFMELIARLIAEGRFRFFPKSTIETLGIYPIQSMSNLELISSAIARRVVSAFDIMAIQVLKILGPEVLYSIGAYLESVPHILLARTAHSPAGTHLGVTNQAGSALYIAVALEYFGQDRTRFGIASTFFHELVHVATWQDKKVDNNEYMKVYEYYRSTIGLDEFTSVGRVAKRETVVRAFHGALFGTQQNSLTEEEFELGVIRWQERYPKLLELVLRDRHIVFSRARYQKVETATMAVTTVRMIPEELLGRRAQICTESVTPPEKQDPIRRSVNLWLREQALQAEQDPDREWLGFRHEFDLLKTGQHPDPHPEHIILYDDTKEFDPTTILEPEDEILISDCWAYNEASIESNSEEHGYPVNSQQLLAMLCRKRMDFLLGITEDS